MGIVGFLGPHEQWLCKASARLDHLKENSVKGVELLNCKVHPKHSDLYETSLDDLCQSISSPNSFPVPSLWS
jgi:hypothetical protein